MASRLQDVILRGTAALRPLATAVAPGTLYYSSDTAVTERSNGTIWETYADAGSGLVPLHAPTHASAGTDPVNVTALSGYPGGTTTFLRADHTFASIIARRQITLIIDGGGSVITTGQKGYLSLPVAGTWMKWRVLSIDAAVTAGSIVIDVWKSTFAAYPPVVGGTIIPTGTKPTLSGVNRNESTTFTGWTTGFTVGDVLGFNVDSVATVTKISLTLEFE